MKVIQPEYSLRSASANSDVRDVTRQPRLQCSLIVVLTLCVVWFGSAFFANPRACAEPITADRLLLSTSADTTKTYPEVNAAIEKLQAQDVNGALELLKIASKSNPELPPARMVLARMMYANNQATAGRANVEQMIRDEPGEPDAYLILGDIAFQERRHTEAELLFEKAQRVTETFDGPPVRKKSYQIRTFAGLAAVAEARRDWESAEKNISQWIALDTGNSGAHFRLGRTLFGLEKHDEAYQELKAAADLDEKQGSPDVVMGQLHQQMGDKTQAAEWMQKAVKSQPDDLKTRLSVSRWAWQAGLLDEAMKHAEAAMKIDSNSLSAKLLCGMVARYSKEFKAAERYFELAHLQSPGNFAATNQLALVLVAQNEQAKRRRALELATLNARQYPKNSEVAATLGWVYYQMRRLNEAESALKQAASAGKMSADAAYYFAKVSYDLGRAKQAKTLLELALNTTGTFAHRGDAETWLAQLSEE